MQSHFRLSIVTVIRNDAVRFLKTLSSVRRQESRLKFEYIVIDGASTDRTSDILRSYQSEINLCISEPDQGLYDAMNKGARSASGDYILFLNAGDELASNQVVKEVLTILETEESAVFYGDSHLVRDSLVYRMRALPIEQLKWRMITSHQAFIARRELILDHPFSLHWKFGSDYEQLLHLYLRGLPFKKMNLFVSRVESNGIAERNALQTLFEHTQVSIQALPSLVYSLAFWIDRGIQFLQCLLRKLPQSFQMLLYRFKYRKQLLRSAETTISLRLGVVIPSYKTSETQLRNAVSSITSQIKPGDIIEIHIVDSESDRSSAEFSDFPSNVTFHSFKERMFSGKARNLGASKLLHHDILVFLDSDCCWNNGWLSAFRNFVAMNLEWDMLNGPVYFERPDLKWPMALHFVEFHEFTSSKSFRPRFPHSGNLVIRRSLFDRLDGFQSDWVACEDIGMLSKLSKQELIKTRIHYIPELAITHSAHLIDGYEVIQKARNLGAWRSMYNGKLPKRVQKPIKLVSKLPAVFIGTIFFTMIVIRSIKNPTLYRSIAWKCRKEIFVVLLEWAKGFKNSSGGENIYPRPQSS